MLNSPIGVMLFCFSVAAAALTINIMLTRSDNKGTAVKEIDDLTEKIFTYLGIHPEDNLLYTALFMNDYANHLTAYYNPRSFKRNLYGKYRFTKIKETDLEKAARELTALYVEFEDSSENVQLREIIKKASGKLGNDNSLQAGFNKNILKELFHKDDRRIILNRTRIKNNIRKYNYSRYKATRARLEDTRSKWLMPSSLS